MRRLNRSTALAATVLTVALVASACGRPERSPGPQRLVDGGTLTIAVTQDPGNLDPQHTVLVVGSQFAAFAYDTLVSVDADRTTVPGIAQEWEGSGTGYTFTLRPDVTCADGSPLTASDVADNFRYLADPANASPLLGQVVPPGLTVRADDATRTVRMTLAAPFPFFTIGLAGVRIVCAGGLADRELLAQATRGTGPYVLSSAVPGDSYTYTRRAGYAWGRGGATTNEPGMPAQVVLKVVPNATTAANQLLSGEVNLAAVDQSDRRRLDAAGLAHRDARVPAGQMYFNQAPGRPAAERDVRRALTMAVDLDQLGAVITGGSGQPSHGMLTLEPRACTGDTVTGNLPAHDPAGAERLLDAAGWRRGPDGVRVKDGAPLSLRLVHSTIPDTTAAAAELAVSQWQAVGVEVTVSAKPVTQVSSTLFQTGDWDISWAQVAAALPSQLVPFVSGAEPPNGTNFGHVRNADYDRLAGAAATRPDTAGCPEWSAAEAALVDALDVVPYYDWFTGYYANNATFEMIGLGYVPTSLRLLAG